MSVLHSPSRVFDLFDMIGLPEALWDDAVPVLNDLLDNMPPPIPPETLAGPTPGGTVTLMSSARASAVSGGPPGVHSTVSLPGADPSRHKNYLALTKMEALYGPLPK